MNFDDPTKTHGVRAAYASLVRFPNELRAAMKTRVTKSGLTIPLELLGGFDEVEIRKEQHRVVIEPIRGADPILALGTTPIDECNSDASVNHDAYIHTK